jgi:uncharacterized membrane protein
MDASVEERLRSLEARIAAVEAGPRATPPREKPFPLGERTPPPVLERASVPTPTPARVRESLDLEELLGGRLLGWVGGVAIVLAAAFFVTVALQHGWIDERVRVALAFAASTALFVAGVWLYERKGKTQAALAACAAATAALFATDTAATVGYALLPPWAGLLVAAAVGIAATAIAVRWESPIVAGLGIVGALLAPVLVRAGDGTLSLAFVAVALVAATSVALWRRWAWLAGLSWLATVPQAAFWLAHERHEHLGRALLALAALWAVHAVAALGSRARNREPDTQIAAGALTVLNSTAAVAGGWTLLHLAQHGNWATAWVLVAALVHLMLAVGAVAARDDEEVADVAALLVALGGAYLAAGTALALHGPALVAAWSAEAVVLAAVARRRRDLRAYAGAALYLLLAAGHVVVREAPPKALLYGVDSLPRALGALAIVGIAIAAVALLLRGRHEDEEHALWRAAGVWALYLCSLAVVDVTGAHAGGIAQHPQFALSAFWAALGLALLLVGLRRGVRTLRLCGFALLGVAVAKVFVLDLAALGSLWRVGSLLALGLMLLGGAFAYQRSRLHVQR